jgi:hypothetical protein
MLALLSLVRRMISGTVSPRLAGSKLVPRIEEGAGLLFWETIASLNVQLGMRSLLLFAGSLGFADGPGLEPGAVSFGLAFYHRRQ